MEKITKERFWNRVSAIEEAEKELGVAHEDMLPLKAKRVYDEPFGKTADERVQNLFPGMKPVLLEAGRGDWNDQFIYRFDDNSALIVTTDAFGQELSMTVDDMTAPGEPDTRMMDAVVFESGKRQRRGVTQDEWNNRFDDLPTLNQEQVPQGAPVLA